MGKQREKRLAKWKNYLVSEMTLPMTFPHSSTELSSIVSSEMHAVSRFWM